MNMPKMQPIPIETKNKKMIVRIWKWITSVRKWEVTEDWSYELPDETIIVVPEGFDFDGASIPRILWGLLSPTGLLLVPGLIHDFAYRYDYLIARDETGCEYRYQENSGQEHWDRLFRQVGLRVNGLALIDTLAWLALYLFGWWAWHKNREKKAAELRPLFSS